MAGEGAEERKARTVTEGSREAAGACGVGADGDEAAGVKGKWESRAVVGRETGARAGAARKGEQLQKEEEMKKVALRAEERVGAGTLVVPGGETVDGAEDGERER